MNVHGLSSVPADIILEIVAHLEAQKDLLHLSFVVPIHCTPFN